MGKVGYQDGLKAAYQRIKKIDPAGCNPNYNPDDPDAIPVDQLKAWDKVHRTLKIMKEDHDAAIPSNGDGDNGDTPPPVNPWDSGYAPRAYNQGSRGQNCIFNVHINCTILPNGDYIDKNGITYSDSGLCNGGRSETPDIPTLKAADMKDQAEPWDAYEWFGNTIGPNKENYPADSYKK